MGVFSKDNQPTPNIKRNTFDLSRQNNLTMTFGKLYPCFVQEVLPGDSIKLDTAFGMRMMPLAFPIQTKVRMDVHFFYVRTRNLWKDWQDFIGNNKSGLELPYLHSPLMKVETGSLCDYMGLPTTSVSNPNIVNYTISDSKVKSFGIDDDSDFTLTDINVYHHTFKFNGYLPV